MLVHRESPFVCVVAHESGLSTMDDCLKRQTATATPAKPGGFPRGLKSHLPKGSSSWRALSHDYRFFGKSLSRLRCDCLPPPASATQYNLSKGADRAEGALR